MANNLNSNPIFLDTVMGMSAKNSGITFTGQFKIKQIAWSTPGSTAADTVILQDGSGNTIFDQTSGRAAPVAFNPPLIVNDFQLTVIADGHLLIYLV